MDNQEGQLFVFASLVKHFEDSKEYKCKTCEKPVYISNKGIITTSSGEKKSPIVPAPFNIEDKIIICTDCAIKVAEELEVAIKMVEQLGIND